MSATTGTLALALALAAGGARTETLDWNAQFDAEPKTFAACGDSLTFEWGGYHDVHRMNAADYEACLFKGFQGATAEAEYLGEAPGVTVAGTPGETEYFSCSVSDHCARGQKVAVTWGSAGGADCNDDVDYAAARALPTAAAALAFVAAAARA